MQSAGTEIANNYGIRPCLQESSSFVVCSLNWPNRRRPEWLVFHLLWQCNFSRYWWVTSGMFFIWISPNGLRGVKMVCRPSLFSLPSDESWLEDWSGIKRASSVKQELFPIVWNSDVTHHPRAIKFPPVCPWMEFWEVMHHWNLTLLLPW